ncbi:MAG: long-chain fatty acid--CoA ligase [Deltaproteobacteria bacterium]|nr:long-chain fatty acid--CoA ligase [Deltaproteobacteria bacterium]
MNAKPWAAQYPEHVPQALAYPRIPVFRFLTDTAAAHPDDVAMTFNDVSTTYRELNDKVNRFASVLEQAGVRKGDRVALILVNSPTYVIAFFAVLKLGALAANLSVGIAGEELASCLQNAGARVVVTLDVFAQNLYRIIRQTGVRTVIVHSVFGLEKKIDTSSELPTVQIFNDLLAAVDRAGEPQIDVLPEDAAVLQYTSGSTGTPKAATLTHANMVASVLQTDAWIGIDNAGNAAVMCLIPFFHVFGLLSCLCVCVHKGYRMILLPRMDLLDVLSLTRLLETYRPIFFPAVPSLWNALLSFPEEKIKGPLGSLQVAICGGGPFPKTVHERFTALTGRRMMEAYGLSEACSATHITPYPAGGPAGSIGLPLPDTDAKIVDLETGKRECAADEVGELVVRGPQIMRGYWNNGELTAGALRGGWFYTGDMARMDKEGFFYIVDRKDDLIISHGFNVYPGQVEEVLKRHPAVKDAAVIGVSDRSRGQAVVAVVALAEGGRADAAEILKYCGKNMPDYRVPKSIVFREVIPRDPAGKLLRRALKAEVKNA